MAARSVLCTGVRSILPQLTTGKPPPREKKAEEVLGVVGKSVRKAQKAQKSAFQPEYTASVRVALEGPAAPPV